MAHVYAPWRQCYLCSPPCPALVEHRLRGINPFELPRIALLIGNDALDFYSEGTPWMRLRTAMLFGLIVLLRRKTSLPPLWHGCGRVVPSIMQHLLASWFCGGEDSILSSHSRRQHLCPKEASFGTLDDLLVHAHGRVVHYHGTLLVVDLGVDTRVSDQIDDPLLAFVLG